MSGTAVLPIVASGSNVDGAWEYNLRTAPWTQLPLPAISGDCPLLEDGLPPQVARITATLLGLWVDLPASDCRPHVGSHADGCLHRENLILTTHSQLAFLAYRRDGGSQIKLVRDSLEQADSYRTVIYLWNREERAYRRKTVKLITIAEATDLDEADAALTSGRLAIGLDPFLWRSMMSGHYQIIPRELVQGLRGVGFLIWTAALSQRETAHLRTAGDSVVFSLRSRGRKPADIRPQSLALAQMRPDKRRAAIVRECNRGNELQSDWRLVPEDEGEAIRLILLSTRAQSDSEPSRSFGPSLPYARTDSTVVPDRFDRSSGRDPRSNGATRQVDGRQEETNPIFDVLKTKGWKNRSPKQLARIREIAIQRRIRGDADVARIIEEGYPGRDHADLFEWLKAYRPKPRPIRTIDDIKEPEPLEPIRPREAAA